MQAAPNKELVETQLGQLLFTTDLSISEEEHKTITDYLSSLVEQPNHDVCTAIFQTGEKKQSLCRQSK